MFRNYFFINILLIAAFSILGVKLYKEIMHKKTDPANITVKKTEPEKIIPVSEDKGIDKESLQVITEKDIFRPSRRSSPMGADGKSMTPLKNPPTLFGTIIVGAEKRALLREDTGKAARIYRVNESVSGYKIIDIQDDKVLLDGGGQTIEVKLRGKKERSASQVTPGAAVQRTQEGSIRRRVRPNPSRPVINETNGEISPPSSAPPAQVTQPVPSQTHPVPDSDSLSVPASPDGADETPDGIRDQ